MSPLLSSQRYTSAFELLCYFNLALNLSKHVLQASFCRRRYCHPCGRHACPAQERRSFLQHRTCSVLQQRSRCKIRRLERNLRTVGHQRPRCHRPSWRYLFPRHCHWGRRCVMVSAWLSVALRLVTHLSASSDAQAVCCENNKFSENFCASCFPDL